MSIIPFILLEMQRKKERQYCASQNKDKEINQPMSSYETLYIKITNIEHKYSPEGEEFYKVYYVNVKYNIHGLLILYKWNKGFSLIKNNIIKINDIALIDMKITRQNNKITKKEIISKTFSNESKQEE